MTYQSIIDAISQGERVCWFNIGYTVVVENGKIYSRFERNGYYILMAENEYLDCFIN